MLNDRRRWFTNTLSAVAGASAAATLFLGGAHFEASWRSTRAERDSLGVRVQELEARNTNLTSALRASEERRRILAPARTFLVNVGERQEAFRGALELGLSQFDTGPDFRIAATFTVRHRGEPAQTFRVAVGDSVNYLHYRIGVQVSGWAQGRYCNLWIRQVAARD